MKNIRLLSHPINMKWLISIGGAFLLIVCWYFSDITWNVSAQTSRVGSRDARASTLNHAPVLDISPTPFFSTIIISTTDYLGDSIASIVVDGTITDTDGLAGEAIAITSVDATHGVWQYSLNNGDTWTNVVSETGSFTNITTQSLLLDGTLTATNTQKIRFVPDIDWTGRVSMTMRAWDKSSGTAGSRADTTLNGSSTPFSANEETVLLDVGEQVALAITKEGPASATYSSTITYTLVATNNGNDTAYSVLMTDTLSPDVSFVHASDGAVHNGNNVQWSLDSLAAGDMVSRTLTVITPLSPTTSIVNDTYAVSAAGGYTTTGTTAIQTELLPNLLTIEKTGTSQAESETLIDYTLTITSQSKEPLYHLIITDSVPMSTTFVAASDGGWLEDGIVYWKIDQLAAEETQSVTLTVRAPIYEKLSMARSITSRSNTPEERIVGGEPADEGDWTWQAVLVSTGETAESSRFCGAVLIQPQWLVTAAHCVTNNKGVTQNFQEIESILGRRVLSSSDGERIGLTKIIVHPAFDPISLEHDIALLKLARPSTQTFIPIATNTDSQLFAPGILATATGWGSLNASGTSYPDELYEVDVPIVSNAVCELGYDTTQGEDDWIKNTMMCAGYAEGGKDACYGDSGGAMVVSDGQDGYLLAGIISWGMICAEPQQYGVYTRMASYSEWLQSYVGLVTVVNTHYGVSGQGGIVAVGTIPVNTFILPSPKTTPALQISKTSVAEVFSQQIFTYTLTITNSGEDTLTNLLVADRVPETVTFVAATHAGSYDGTTVTWDNIELAAGSSISVQFGVRAPQHDSLTHTSKSALHRRIERIVGGTEATPGDWTWQVALWDTLFNETFCGGTLINEEWVLTAAHCVQTIPSNEMEIILGAHNITLAESTQQRREIQQIIFHADFDSISYDNDIALIKLANPAILNEWVQPVELFVDGSQADPGVLATVTGWGTLQEGSTIGSPTLQQVDVPVIANKICEQSYDINKTPNNWITERMLCAGYDEGGKDACAGDSGGPLVVPDGSGGYLQAGIVSWGNGCAEPGLYGVYTRVSSFIDWINIQMAPIITNGSYYVQTTDGIQIYGSQAVQTTVLSNSAPTDITIDMATVKENEPVGTPVGTLTTIDPDATDTHSYSLYGTNKDAFTIDGTVLKTQQIFDYETTQRYTITIYADDGNGGSIDKTFTILIQDVNEAPIAATDTYTVAEDSSLTVTAEQGLLSNDTDPDQDDIKLVAAIKPTHGSITMPSDGSFTYVPDADFYGEESFTYSVEDGCLISEFVPVTITVEPVNDPPTLIVNERLHLMQGTSSVLSNTLLQATDKDNVPDRLVYTITHPPTHGKVSIDNEQISAFTQHDIDARRVTYEHDGSLATTDSFTFTVQDDAGAKTAESTFAISLTHQCVQNISLEVGKDVLQSGETTPVTATMYCQRGIMQVDVYVTLFLSENNGSKLASKSLDGIARQGIFTATLSAGDVSGQVLLQATTDTAVSPFSVVTVFNVADRERMPAIVDKPLLVSLPESLSNKMVIGFPTQENHSLITGTLTMYTSPKTEQGQTVEKIGITTITTPTMPLPTQNGVSYAPLGAFLVNLYDTKGYPIDDGNSLTSPLFLELTFMPTTPLPDNLWDIAMLHFDEEEQRWNEDGIEITRIYKQESGAVTIRCQVSHASQFAVFVPLESPDPTPQEVHMVYLPQVLR